MARPANPNLQHMLVEAATEVFGAKGLAEAKVSDITARAGVAKGSFYLHFDSKEALFVQICRTFIDDVVRHLEHHAAVMCNNHALGPEFLDRLAQADEGLMDLLWQRRQHLAMVLQGAAGTQVANLADEFVDAIERTMRTTIVEAHATLPVESPMSPDFLAAVATGLVLMVARRLASSGERPAFARDVQHFRRILMIGGVLSGDQLDEMLARCGSGLPCAVPRPDPAEAGPWVRSA